MQSRAGIENPDYLAQKELLKKIDSNELSRQTFLESKTTKHVPHE